MNNYPQHLDSGARRQISAWLLVCCVMIFAMVILGGVTRLTGSGLSMVEWNPIFGLLPPMGQQAWETVFSKYQQSPEYQKINIGMDLEGFKSIYWFEYSHRILGRGIGIVFLLPFLYFLWQRKLTPRLIVRLAIAFVLGGLQGLLGWYMVKSGLVDNPHVSQYRLTAHLGLALVIYAFLLWQLFNLLFQDTARSEHHRGLKKGINWILALVSITIASGGFVAGLKAGHAYNTFPKMGDQWLPPQGWSMQPGWRNLFENIATVQFDHRVLAILTAVTILLFWLKARRHELTSSARLATNLLMAMVIVQLGLGISTLLLHVPISLAVIHQAGALLLLTFALLAGHRLYKC